jgi:hypothetical protein
LHSSANSRCLHGPGEPPGNESLLERRGNGKGKISKMVVFGYGEHLSMYITSRPEVMRSKISKTIVFGYGEHLRRSRRC